MAKLAKDEKLHIKNLKRDAREKEITKMASAVLYHFGTQRCARTGLLVDPADPLYNPMERLSYTKGNMTIATNGLGKGMHITISEPGDRKTVVMGNGITVSEPSDGETVYSVSAWGVIKGYVPTGTWVRELAELYGDALRDEGREKVSTKLSPFGLRRGISEAH